MNIKLLFFSVLLLFFLVALTYAATEGYVSIDLSNSTIWWNDTVTASGTAKYTNGTGISDSDLVITLNGITYCTSTTTSSGIWSCSFQGPTELGKYTFQITVTNSTGTQFTNTTTLWVKPSYGPTMVGRRDRVVYEQPMLIQDMNGKIKQVWARVKIWKK